MTPEPEEQAADSLENEGPLWSITSRMQIILIAVAIGLFNCLLIGIFAAVFFLRSG